MSTTLSQIISGEPISLQKLQTLLATRSVEATDSIFNAEHARGLLQQQQNLSGAVLDAGETTRTLATVADVATEGGSTKVSIIERRLQALQDNQSSEAFRAFTELITNAFDAQLRNGFEGKAEVHVHVAQMRKDGNPNGLQVVISDRPNMFVESRDKIVAGDGMSPQTFFDYFVTPYSSGNVAGSTTGGTMGVGSQQVFGLVRNSQDRVVISSRFAETSADTSQQNTSQISSPDGSLLQNSRSLTEMVSVVAVQDTEAVIATQARKINSRPNTTPNATGTKIIIQLSQETCDDIGLSAESLERYLSDMFIGYDRGRLLLHPPVEERLRARAKEMVKSVRQNSAEPTDLPTKISEVTTATATPNRELTTPKDECTMVAENELSSLKVSNRKTNQGEPCKVYLTMFGVTFGFPSEYECEAGYPAQIFIDIKDKTLVTEGRKVVRLNEEIITSLKEIVESTAYSAVGHSSAERLKILFALEPTLLRLGDRQNIPPNLRGMPKFQIESSFDNAKLSHLIARARESGFYCLPYEFLARLGNTERLITLPKRHNKEYTAMDLERAGFTPIEGFEDVVYVGRLSRDQGQRPYVADESRVLVDSAVFSDWETPEGQVKIQSVLGNALDAGVLQLAKKPRIKQQNEGAASQELGKSKLDREVILRIFNEYLDQLKIRWQSESIEEKVAELKCLSDQLSTVNFRCADENCVRDLLNFDKLSNRKTVINEITDEKYKIGDPQKSERYLDECLAIICDPLFQRMKLEDCANSIFTLANRFPNPIESLSDTFHFFVEYANDASDIYFFFIKSRFYKFLFDGYRQGWIKFSSKPQQEEQRTLKIHRLVENGFINTVDMYNRQEFTLLQYLAVLKLHPSPNARPIAEKVKQLIALHGSVQNLKPYHEHILENCIAELSLEKIILLETLIHEENDGSLDPNISEIMEMLLFETSFSAKKLTNIFLFLKEVMRHRNTSYVNWSELITEAIEATALPERKSSFEPNSAIMQEVDPAELWLKTLTGSDDVDESKRSVALREVLHPTNRCVTEPGLSLQEVVRNSLQAIARARQEGRQVESSIRFSDSYSRGAENQQDEYWLSCTDSVGMNPKEALLKLTLPSLGDGMHGLGFLKILADVDKVIVHTSDGRTKGTILYVPMKEKGIVTDLKVYFSEENDTEAKPGTTVELCTLTDSPQAHSQLAKERIAGYVRSLDVGDGEILFESGDGRVESLNRPIDSIIQSERTNVSIHYKTDTQADGVSTITYMGRAIGHYDIPGLISNSAIPSFAKQLLIETGLTLDLNKITLTRDGVGILNDQVVLAEIQQDIEERWELLLMTLATKGLLVLRTFLQQNIGPRVFDSPDEAASLPPPPSSLRGASEYNAALYFLKTAHISFQNGEISSLYQLLKTVQSQRHWIDALPTRIARLVPAIRFEKEQLQLERSLYQPFSNDEASSLNRLLHLAQSAITLEAEFVINTASEEKTPLPSADRRLLVHKVVGDSEAIAFYRPSIDDLHFGDHPFLDRLELAKRGDINALAKVVVTTVHELRHAFERSIHTRGIHPPEFYKAVEDALLRFDYASAIHMLQTISS